MAKFDYTLPSGATFSVLGPNTATQSQADYVFYTQVAAGSLIGYQSGQTLAGTSVSTNNFSLNRLERGTAGVASQPLLAVHTRADILSSILTSLAADPSGRLPSSIAALIAQAESSAGLPSAAAYLADTATQTSAPPLDDATIQSILQHLPIVAGMPPLNAVPITNPVTQADVIQARGTGLGPSDIGALSAFQVQSLQAQLKNVVGQPYNQMSQEKGIGKFGFTCYQLEKTGYVKPTTQARFIDPNPSSFESVMRSPLIWLGKNGVDSIDQILEDEQLQNTIQSELMACGYAGLEASGVISQTPQNATQPTRGWVYQNGSLTSTGLQSLTRTGLLGGQTSPTASLITELSIDYTGVGSGVANTPQNSLNLKSYYYNQVQGTLQSKVTGDVGALTLNASKFGSETTSLWATAGGTNNFSKMLLTGRIAVSATTTDLNSYAATVPQSLASSATNPITAVSVNSGVTNFSNFGASGLSAIPDNISSALNNQVVQISNSMDLMGKAGQFATNFGDIGKNFGDLTSIDKLGDLASGGFDKLGDLATGQINNLKGLADGAINSISSGFDKLAKIDLGSMADVGKLTGLVDKAGGLSGLLNKGADLSKLFGGNNALTSGIKVAAGYSETINRETVDAAVDRIIGSAKINPPTFTPSSSSGSFLDDIKAAKDSLSGLAQQATGVMSTTKDVLAQNGVTSFSGAAWNKVL